MALCADYQYMEQAVPGLGYLVLMLLVIPLLRGVLHFHGVHKKAAAFQSGRELSSRASRDWTSHTEFFG